MSDYADYAKKLNLKEKTIYFYSTPANLKRCKGENHKIAIKL